MDVLCNVNLNFYDVVNDLEQKEQTIAQLQEQVRELHKQIQVQSDSMKSVGDWDGYDCS